ncbi:nucleoside triphosphate pyrophosphatase [Microbulbifer sp. GL-2]|uniref:Maf family protein n=1 Tax=Microbulbifer sp. GL-2 TaxID=2591606 RepID=UPI001165C6DE|nr:nucleoside triphosphate pyrophosphatase [Microbulbifer sp. GL-2]BBM03767.1 Maf-like protein [Microbulbifer sp. GL-2]
MAFSLILASSSPYRRALLQQLRLPFGHAAPHIDEEAKPGESANSLALRLAEEKALALAPINPQSLIIGSDQVAECDGRILGKPGGREQAIAQLSACSGSRVTFYTGLSVFNSATRRQISSVETYTVHFRQLNAGQIERYVELEKPYDCAGSFKVEGLGITLFEKLEGSDINTLVGLPLIRLVDFLGEFGVSPLAPVAKGSGAAS